MAQNKEKKLNTVKPEPRPMGRLLKGVVVSDKMQKTVVVEVNWLKLNKKYKRRFRQTKRYQAHDPEGKFKVGDRISIIECRPISKKKRWRVRYDGVKS